MKNYSKYFLNKNIISARVKRDMRNAKLPGSLSHGTTDVLSNTMDSLHPLDVDDDNDVLLSTLPVHFSKTLAPSVHLHQFPLLTRPLQVPPSAAQAGKHIRVRVKPKSSRIEVHVPVDTRPEVWNKDRSKELGQARARDDLESAGTGAGTKKMKEKEVEGEENRLTEVRLQSEPVPDRGIHMLGIVRDGAFLLDYSMFYCAALNASNP